MADVGFSPATRVFEAAGAGACLITDAWEGIELFLEPGEEVLVARDGQDVAEHLAAPRRPSAPARSARPRSPRVLAEHTYARAAPSRSDALLRASRCARRRSAQRERARRQLVVLGLSLSSSWGNGHATTYRALLARLRRARPRGHCSSSATCPGTPARTATCPTRTSADSPSTTTSRDLDALARRRSRPPTR